MVEWSGHRGNSARQFSCGKRVLRPFHTGVATVRGRRLRGRQRKSLAMLSNGPIHTAPRRRSDRLRTLATSPLRSLQERFFGNVARRPAARACALSTLGSRGTLRAHPVDIFSASCAVFTKQYKFVISRCVHTKMSYIKIFLFIVKHILNAIKLLHNICGRQYIYYMLSLNV